MDFVHTTETHMKVGTNQSVFQKPKTSDYSVQFITDIKLHKIIRFPKLQLSIAGILPVSKAPTSLTQ